MSPSGFLLAVAAFLTAWGLGTSWLAGRAGLNQFAWWVIGTSLGPVSLPALLSVARSARAVPPEPLRLGSPARPGAPRVLVSATTPAGFLAAATCAQSRLGWFAPSVTLTYVTDADHAPTTVGTSRGWRAVQVELESAPAFEQARASVSPSAVERQILFGEPVRAIAAELARRDYASVVVVGGGLARRRRLARLVGHCPVPLLVAMAPPATAKSHLTPRVHHLPISRRQQPVRSN